MTPLLFLPITIFFAMDPGTLRMEQSGSKAASDWYHQRLKQLDWLEVWREITQSLLQPSGSEVGAVRADLATLLVTVCVKIGLALFSFHKLVFATMRGILQKRPPCLFLSLSEMENVQPMVYHWCHSHKAFIWLPHCIALTDWRTPWSCEAESSV